MKQTKFRRTLLFLISLLGICVVALVAFEPHILSADTAHQDKSKQDLTFDKIVQPFFAQHCYHCHNKDLKTANLNLGAFDTAASLTNDRATLKRILEKLSAGEMPPPEMTPPKPADIVAVTQWLARQLAALPNTSKGAVETTDTSSGRVTVRRLNRVEYDNTVRDLLGVDRHSSDDFPQDDSGYGFDNIADVLSISPVLMEKYLTAAEKISRTAIFGNEPMKPTLVSLRSGQRNQKPQMTPLTDYDLTGLSMPNAFHTTYRFPIAGEYVLRVNLGGDRPAGSEALRLALWIDGTENQQITVDPATVASFADAAEPQQLWGVKTEFRVTLTAGDHWLAITIPRLYEGLPPSYNGPNPSKRVIPPPTFKPPRNATPAEVEEHRKEFEKRLAEKIPANSARIGSVELGGPYAAVKGPSIENQKKIYACGHLNGNHEKRCSRVIVERLAHRAYRRPVTTTEVAQLTKLIAQVQKDNGSFEEGLAVGIQAMLLSPHFLFRIEARPPARAAKASTSLTQHELASRLSYFLWSSMPDDELLAAADRGKLSRPATLAAQVRRMLLDPKADALANNFPGQWLQTRALESVKPDRKKFPDFDEYLRLSMARETALFFKSILREDRSILDFIDADYSYLNERLARFYGLTDVQGPEFRKVSFPNTAQRGGLLTHASVLTISSYANRTSPVLRGKWVLDNLLGSPPPPPPPDVPNLNEEKIGTTSSMREQLELHRKNPICASCHVRMDPLGFGLENFDAVGAWRAKDGEFPINASGELPDGRSFTGPQGLKSILKAQPDRFTETLTRKLLMYALGRGLEPADDVAVNEIVNKVAADNYRMSSLILGIVNSQPFQKRRGESSR
jgi:Protein of unknown function (DUF1592)/Protein of unknown function (DUF1588)/Protein of unknown function (DUF1587)/Protein of unknown function (DUF1585)/Protein of unknown function (DUF1595)/Planctomycete cytochrome C